MSRALAGASVTSERLIGLDGLRALAVLLVIFHHRGIFHFGWIGVQIFFVLSGYLITRSLHRARDIGIARYFCAFYGRRALRVFPLYFTVLASFAVAVAVGLKSPIPGTWHAATYTYNFWHASTAFRHSMLVSHFWSLCVEEQFYLVWPLVIYFYRHNLNSLRRLLLALVLAGPLIRIALHSFLEHTSLPVLEAKSLALYVLTPSHADAFALGGYAALFPWRTGTNTYFWLSLLATLGGGVAVLTFGQAHPWLTLDSLGYALGLPSGYAYVWGYSLINLTSALAIMSLVKGKLALWLFENTFIRYIGTVSYGVYIFHYPVQWLTMEIFPKMPILSLSCQLALTFALSAASFELFERRFLGLKELWFPSRPADNASSALLKVHP